MLKRTYILFTVQLFFSFVGTASMADQVSVTQEKTKKTLFSECLEENHDILFKPNSCTIYRKGLDKALQLCSKQIGIKSAGKDIFRKGGKTLIKDQISLCKQGNSGKKFEDLADKKSPLPQDIPSLKEKIEDKKSNLAAGAEKLDKELNPQIEEEIKKLNSDSKSSNTEKSTETTEDITPLVETEDPEKIDNDSFVSEMDEEVEALE